MPTADLGSIGRRVAENVKSARGRIPLRELAGRLKAVGRTILASGLVKIEQGKRRVDVDDLVALALALGVTPTELLGIQDSRRAAGGWNLAEALQLVTEAVRGVIGGQATSGDLCALV